MNKIELRSEFLQSRLNTSKQQQINHNHQLVNHIKQSDLWLTAHSVAIYLAFNGEADISALLQTDKLIYLPAIKGQRMQFQLFTTDTVFETLSYGLKQPKYIDDLIQDPIDLYLMPLVAYDIHGNRLGMGGGFYDRYFASDVTGIRAGVAFSSQRADQLPVDQWDVTLQHIFTEQGHLIT
ncbi:5-formyltetrahydrofolate cyclo-ligase [Marinicella litoralis]|uniref:5-formyltetrahydrofolate cyclo-ligase n=1 Tax=Marinicella litoralis TaxID=644220 RepID=A0A4R6XC94_9GAMM|nr:5-formyltetrahydrofolate cyclo-ligase [Marinicella litoralis]TDR16836.1 5-formyltetrahydrofolate cyclo-ligase [Marinicella litoralis]